MAVGSSPAISVNSRRSSCLLLDCASVGGAGAGLVLGDEILQVPPLGEDGFVRAFLVLALLSLEFQIGIDLAGKGRQFAAGQIERVVAGGAQKRPIVGDDQARRPMALQEVFQEDLRAQVEKVRRLVEQQEIRLVQQQGRQLHARLPAAGELGDGAFQVGPLQLELPGDFAAFPVGLDRCRASEIRARSRREERDRAAADSPGAGWDGG